MTSPSEVWWTGVALSNHTVLVLIWDYYRSHDVTSEVILPQVSKFLIFLNECMNAIWPKRANQILSLAKLQLRLNNNNNIPSCCLIHDWMERTFNQGSLIGVSLFFPFLLEMQGNQSEERKNEDVSRVTKKGDQRLFISEGLNHPWDLQLNAS